MATLIIGSWSSRCGTCKQGANPEESGHYTKMSYSAQTDPDGCGEKWHRVYLDFLPRSEGGSFQMKKSLVQKWPHLADLKWVLSFEDYRKNIFSVPYDA